MALDGLTLKNLKIEFAEKLIGGKIDKITQPGKTEINLTIRNNKENYKLLINSNPSLPQIYLKQDFNKENPFTAPMFLMVLRKHILSAAIDDIRQIGTDRIIIIDISLTNELRSKVRKSLVVEIMGKHSNIILLETDSGKIIDSIKKVPADMSSYRQVVPGADYKLPPSENKIDPCDIKDLISFSEKLLTSGKSIFKALYTSITGLSPAISKEICFRAGIDCDISSNDMSSEDYKKLYDSFQTVLDAASDKSKSAPCLIYDETSQKPVEFSFTELSLYKDAGYKVISDTSMSKICELYYKEKDFRETLKQKSSNMMKVINGKINLIDRKIEKQSNELNLTLTMDEYKHEADLLTAYIYMIKKGDKSITVNDFYDEENKLITIKLDENLTPSANVQSRYKRYNKFKNRKKELTYQINSAKEELNYLYNLQLSLKNAVTLDDIREIKAEMIKENLLKPKKEKNSRKKSVKNNNTADISEPLKFKTQDGIEILVGKNNVQNDYITLKLADKDDIWMHAKDIPGSHVIIRTCGKEIPEETLLMAAKLAAKHSKAADSSNVPVDYTKKRFVKKPAGARPGMVIYKNNSTIYVTP